MLKEDTKAIGTMYLYNRNLVDAFVDTVKKAEELYSKLEEQGIDDAKMTILADKYDDYSFEIKIEGTNKFDIRKEKEES